MVYVVGGVVDFDFWYRILVYSVGQDLGASEGTTLSFCIMDCRNPKESYRRIKASISKAADAVSFGDSGQSTNQRSRPGCIISIATW